MFRRPSDLSPADFPISHRPITAHVSEVTELVSLCANGPVYEVDDWIATGRPIQAVPSQDKEESKHSTPLSLAVYNRNHSLAELLLASS